MKNNDKVIACLAETFKKFPKNKALKKEQKKIFNRIYNIFIEDEIWVIWVLIVGALTLFTYSIYLIFNY